MSVASALTAMQADITAARAAITTKGGTVTPSGGSSQLATDIATIPSGGGNNWLIDACEGDDVPITPSINNDISTIINNGYANNRFGSLNLVGILDLSSITSLNMDYMNSAFRRCKKLTGVNLSSLTTIYTNSLNSAFQECSEISGKIDLSALIYAYGYPAANAFRDCKKITEIDLRSSTGGNFSSSSSTMPFAGCSGIKTVHVNVACIKGTYNYSHILTGCSEAIENVYLYGTAEDSMTFANSPNLTSASVLNILQHCSNVVSGKTCSFANLTISSLDENYAAIVAKVAELTNWTITGLTL